MLGCVHSRVGFAPASNLRLKLKEVRQAEELNTSSCKCSGKVTQANSQGGANSRVERPGVLQDVAAAHARFPRTQPETLHAQDTNPPSGFLHEAAVPPELLLNTPMVPPGSNNQQPMEPLLAAEIRRLISD